MRKAEIHSLRNKKKITHFEFSETKLLWLMIQNTVHLS